MSAYAQFDPEAENRRLRLQSEVLEELSDRALARIEPLDGARVLDAGCGAMGILRALSRRVGPRGHVVGADVSEVMVANARDFCAANELTNTEVIQDDAYASKLPARSFDVVHARLLLAPIGRDAELASELERLVKPNGWIVLEEPDGFGAWRTFPEDGAHRALLSLIARAFRNHLGGDESGARLLPLARARGWKDIHFDAQVLAMPPGHPYLQAAVMMATALRSIILRDTPEDELDRAIASVRALTERPDVYGVSYLLMQVWARPKC